MYFIIHTHVSGYFFLKYFKQSGSNIWVNRLFSALNISMDYSCISNNWWVYKLGVLKGYPSLAMDYRLELNRKQFLNVQLLLFFFSF